MSNLVDLVEKEADLYENEAIELRRYFHMYPELSKQEYNTADKIETELKALELNPIRVGTGVVATIKGITNNKTILLRADIDALPIEEKNEVSYKSKTLGVMHACGHDAHAASLLTAAKILVKNKQILNGNVILHFQQAEEVGYGAKQLLKDEYIKDATMCFGVHCASDTEVGKVVCVTGANNASVDYFKITIHGKSAHISNPEKGIDAAYITSSIVIALQSIVTKNTSPLDSVLIGIGKIEAGTAYNIIAGSGTIEGSIRTLSNETRKNIKIKIENLVKNQALSLGAKADIVYKDYTSVLENSVEETKFVQKIAEELLSEDNVITNKAPALSGDDFAEYILKMKGTYAYIGTRNYNIPNTCLPHHNCCFDIDERSIKIAVKMYTGVTLNYLK